MRTNHAGVTEVASIRTNKENFDKGYDGIDWTIKEKPKKTTFHVCMSVEGALRNRDFNGFKNEDGSKPHWTEVKKFLEEQLELGRRVIPMSKECIGFDYQTGCPGHES
jgi:hypothetical protein